MILGSEMSAKVWSEMAWIAREWFFCRGQARSGLPSYMQCIAHWCGGIPSPPGLGEACLWIDPWVRKVVQGAAAVVVVAGEAFKLFLNLVIFCSSRLA